MKQRDNSYDVLRWLALTGIILVHTKPCVFFVQLRSFDVPLMVLVSAVCFALSGGGNSSCETRIYEYYKKRFVRLVLPSWIFLTLYFYVSYLIGANVGLTKVLMCYTLTTNWYFWIIRILVVMAIIAPWLIKVTTPMSDKQLIGIFLLGLGLTELLSQFRLGYIYKIIVMCLPYTVYYCLGINAHRFHERQIRFAGIVLFSIYILYALFLYVKSGEYVPTSLYKYPPQLYYTSYALGISAFLYIYRSKIVWLIEKLKLLNFVSFVGSHTFWIYLWHIPMVDYMVSRYDSPTTFSVVYSSAIMITYIQTKIVGWVCDRVTNLDTRKYIKMIFIG